MGTSLSIAGQEPRPLHNNVSSVTHKGTTDGTLRVHCTRPTRERDRGRAIERRIVQSGQRKRVVSVYRVRVRARARVRVDVHVYAVGRTVGSCESPQRRIRREHPKTCGCARAFMGKIWHDHHGPWARFPELRCCIGRKLRYPMRLSGVMLVIPAPAARHVVNEAAVGTPEQERTGGAKFADPERMPAGSAFARVAQRCLDVSHTIIERLVPTEMTVPEHMHDGPQRLHPIA